MNYANQLREIINESIFSFSDIKPSKWAEGRIKIEVGRNPGPLSFDNTPYSRGILDKLWQHDPVQYVAIMGGSQWGKTILILSWICYLISEHPGKIGYLTGHTDITDSSIKLLDKFIDSAGLRPLIHAQTLRKKNTRTGDTNDSKEYPGGDLKAGTSNNHKLLRFYDYRNVILDDADLTKVSSEIDGDTIKLIDARCTSYGDLKKILYCSTPTEKDKSVIENLYKKGDQNEWHIHCPCCHKPIVIRWEIAIDGSKEKAGMYWKLDNHNNLIPGSVGYVCQQCAGFFTDKKKYELNLNGLWVPGVDHADKRWASFHMPTLYSMPGSDNWEHHVRSYLEAAPHGQPINEGKLRTFYQNILGLPFKSRGEAPSANSIQKNQRNYNHCVISETPAIIPERLSLSDGNGRIILITCGADLGGKVEDARLDYEVVAWSESGASYSLAHGSIGTFIKNEKNTPGGIKDRDKWSYEHEHPKSVWREFDKVVGQKFITDTANPRQMAIAITGLDTSFFTTLYAYPYLDKKNNPLRMVIAGIKGDENKEFVRENVDKFYFKKSAERAYLFSPEVGRYKDDIARYMTANWNRENDQQQPFGFMNYPMSNNGYYSYAGFFSQYESEHCVIKDNKKGGAMHVWEKLTSASENHFWDCRVYNHVAKDIIVEQTGMAYKLPKITWKEFCNLVTGGK